jgi:hypothetical protein
VNEVEAALYKTRKSIIDAIEEIGYADTISLLQCSSCNIWLKPQQLLKDLDGLEICVNCRDSYGL